LRHSRVVKHPVLRFPFCRTDVSDPCACRVVGAFEADPEGVGRGSRSYDSRSRTRGTARLAWMCIQGDLKAVIYGEARRGVEITFFGLRGV